MAEDLSFEKRTHMGACLVLLCSSSVRITGLLDMAINLQLIIKITRSFGSGFQSKSCKAKCQTDHDWEQKSKADIDVRSYRERFDLCYYDSLFFFFFLFFSAIMFIFFHVSRTIMGLTFLHPDTIVKKISYSYSYAYETPTMLV